MSRHICQVAFSALDGPALREWYARVFGLVKSGKVIFFPPGTSNIQGIPGAWEKCSWLIDAQDYFQLEFFQFLKPRSRPRPVNWRPCDIGYNMLGIAVNDFDQVLSRVGVTPDQAAAQVYGEAGQRRACVADPEGNLVEIFEQDPLADGEAATDVRYNLPAWSDACLSHISVGRCQSILAVGHMSIHMSTHRYSLCAGRGATDSEGVVAAAGSDEQVAAHCRWPVVLALSGAAQL